MQTIKSCRKNPNNGNIKSVTVGCQKCAFKLYEPIKQSKIITKQVKIVEKPNSVDIELVTMEHQKDVTNYQRL